MANWQKDGIMWLNAHHACRVSVSVGQWRGAFRLFTYRNTRAFIKKICTGRFSTWTQNGKVEGSTQTPKHAYSTHKLYVIWMIAKQLIILMQLKQNYGTHVINMCPVAPTSAVFTACHIFEGRSWAEILRCSQLQAFGCWQKCEKQVRFIL